MAKGIQCYLEIWRVRKSEQTITGKRAVGSRVQTSLVDMAHAMRTNSSTTPFRFQ